MLSCSKEEEPVRELDSRGTVQTLSHQEGQLVGILQKGTIEDWVINISWYGIRNSPWHHYLCHWYVINKTS